MNITAKQIADSSDVKWLKKQLTSVYELTLRGVELTAQIILRLDQLGEAIPDSISFVNELRAIGRGKMVPQLFIKCMGSSDLLKRAAKVSLNDQRSIAEDQPIAVITSEGQRLIKPSELSRRERDQVFAGRRIRNVEEQTRFLPSLLASQVSSARISLTRPRKLFEELGLGQEAAPHLDRLIELLNNVVSEKDKAA